MEKILTIVIPTYNMQDYLRRCLDSLIVPEEQMKQLEVLVINDGSRDNSSAIAHEYEDKYPDTFRVIDKENGNYGSCVNRGLKEATGKYIKVLDADDWYDTDGLVKYVAFLPSQDADMVLNCCYVKDTNGQVVNTFSAPFMSDESPISFEEFSRHRFFPQMHIVAYKTSVLRAMDYHQTEGISYTDMEWVQKPLGAVNSVSYIKVFLYNYLLGREGQTMSEKVVNRTFNQHCLVAYSLLAFAYSYKGDVCHQQYVEAKAINYMRGLYRKHIIGGVFDDAAFRSFDATIKKEYPMAFKSVSGMLSKKLYISIWRSLSVGKLYRKMLGRF